MTSSADFWFFCLRSNDLGNEDAANGEISYVDEATDKGIGNFHDLFCSSRQNLVEAH